MISYFLIYFFWLLGLFSIGQITIWITKLKFSLNFYETVLRNVFLGYIVVIIIQSIWSTEFSTINLIYLLILLLLYYEVRQKNLSANRKLNFSLKFRDSAILIAAAALFFLYNWFFIYFPESYLKFIYTWGDYILYAKISDSIASTGEENGFNILNTIDSFYHNAEPYHFFDLWGGAAVTNLFKINNYLSLMLVVYPTFYFLCFVGILSLLKKTTYLLSFFSLLLLFTGGVFIRYSESIPFFNNLSNISFNLLSSGPFKLSYFYTFLLAAYLAFLKNKTQGILILLGLPVANIITAPTVFPAIIILLFILYKYNDNKETAKRSLIYSVLTILFFLVFYSINGRESSGLAGAEISSPIKLLSSAFTSEGITTRRNIILASIIGLVIIYAPFVLLIGLNKNRFKTNKMIGLFAFLLIMFSILTWALLYLELNSSQIFYDISIPLINLIFIILVLQIFTNSSTNWKYFLTLIFLCIILIYNVTKNVFVGSSRMYQEHSNGYLEAINKSIPPNSLVGSIKSSESMKEMHSKYNVAYPLGDYLFLLNKNIYSINIGDFNTPIDSTSDMNIQRSIKAVRDGIFYRYIKRNENEGISNEQLVMKFLKEFKIKYLLVADGVTLYGDIINNAEKIIIDPDSKEKFIILK